jgi:hypothetical protein
MRVFLFEQFPRMLRGEATDPFSLTAPSASSFFHRLFITQPQVNPRPFILSPLLFAIFYPLWQLILLCATLLTISSETTDPKRRSLEWAVFVCLLLTLSTEPASYHRVALIFVAIISLSVMTRNWQKAVLIVCYFVACNIHPSIPMSHPAFALVLDFLPYWGLLATLACLLIALGARPSGSLAFWPSWPRKRFAWTLTGLSIIWCAISASTFAHLRSLNRTDFLENRRSGAYAHWAPHFTGNHLLTVAMFLEGYRVEDVEGRRYQTNTNGTEEQQLALASTPGVREVWIEAESKGSSHLVELSVSPDATSTAPVTMIPDAESPALSADGRSLVFLREVKGYARAWMVHLDENGGVLDSPVPITPLALNVSQASFYTPGLVLFSAEDNGLSHIYITDCKEPPRELFTEPVATDSPAANIESGVVIYRQLDGNYWHLYASGPFRDGFAQLTFGDCNAYDPAWRDSATLFFISDCGRGIGLGALAIAHLSTGQDASRSPLPAATLTGGHQGEAQQ